MIRAAQASPDCDLRRQLRSSITRIVSEPARYEVSVQELYGQGYKGHNFKADCEQNQRRLGRGEERTHDPEEISPSHAYLFLGTAHLQHANPIVVHS